MQIITSRNRTLSISLGLFAVVSLIYFLIICQRFLSFQSLNESRESTPNNHEEIGLITPEWRSQLSQFKLPERRTRSLRMENLNSFLIGRGITTYTRPSKLYIPKNSVEYDRRGIFSEASKNDEEFTIIMMTYKRTEMMLNLLQHLSGLPKVNQLLLIWNNEAPPGPEILWPELSFRIRLLSNGKNSLHNRYLPLSLIETEGVFLLDDDSFVNHEKVLLAFQKWQAERDRIVGFKGRGVKPKWISWNDTFMWEYDAGPEPESVSMVLTGSAFFHRKYLKLYTYDMPREMRRIIDESMNCDDIAINFLISDATQKGPIHIPHEHDFLCEGCTDNGLWKDPDHFSERTSCLNQFSKIFGYTPLFKPDSVQVCPPQQLPLSLPRFMTSNTSKIPGLNVFLIIMLCTSLGISIL